MSINPSPDRNAFWKPVLIAGAIAGSADLLFAIFYYGKGHPNPLRIGQSIAGGLFGKATFEGGATTAALGFVLHYLIAAIWAAVYVLTSRRWPLLIRHAIPCGLVFGAIVFYFMNMVVLPLSALQAKAWPPPLVLWPIAIHVLGVGLPIALITRNFQVHQHIHHDRT